MSEMEEIGESFLNKNVDFSLFLYTKTIEELEPDNHNVLISPFSVQLAATLAYFGAVNETAKELAHGLRMSSEDSQEIKESIREALENCENCSNFNIVNKIYISDRYEVKSSFRELVSEKFYSEVENIDFLESGESAALINMWIEEKTQSKIKDIIDPEELDEVTSSILVNAIHFKPEWQFPFAVDDSYQTDFWLSEAESTEIIFMVNRANYRYGEIKNDLLDLSLEVIQLPLKDCNLSMLILLPAFPKDFPNLEEKLPQIELENLMSEMEMQEVIVKIPRFNVDFSTELKQTFKNMGMHKMFTAEADFDEILVEDDPLFVQKIMHRAIIEVNETETVQSTRAHKMLTAEDFPIFAANRPFIYMILDEKKNIFILGKLFRPRPDPEVEQE